MKIAQLSLYFILLTIIFACTHSSTNEQSATCQHCGMQTNNYPNCKVVWTIDKQHSAFYNTNCFFASIFSKDTIAGKLEVMDYYTLQVVDGKQAFYTFGGDISGPMRKCYVAHQNKNAGEAFVKEHYADGITTFQALLSRK